MKSDNNLYSPNSIWFVTSCWHNLTRSTCLARRDKRVKLCCSTNLTQPKCMGSTRSTCPASQACHVKPVKLIEMSVSSQSRLSCPACQVMSRHYVTSQVEFGLNASSYKWHDRYVNRARIPYRYCSKWIQIPPQVFCCLFSRSCASCSTDTVVFPVNLSTGLPYSNNATMMLLYELLTLIVGTSSRPLFVTFDSQQFSDLVVMDA